MPALIFLSLKPCPIPRESYLRLMPLHIWLGRVLVVISTIHGGLYVIYFIINGKQQKIIQLNNFAGVVLTVGFVLTLFVSFYIIRHRNHDLFYRTHLLFSWACIPLIAYHARPRVWTIISLLMSFIGGQLIQRYGSGQECRAQVHQIGNMQLVCLPRKQFPKYFEPGSHVRLSPSRTNSRFWFISASHPYTIASLSTDDSTVQLVVKPTKRFKFEEDREFIVHGPYPSLSYDFFVDMYKSKKPLRRTVIVAGGAGISFAAPIANTLRKMNERVKILWSVRSKSDAMLLKIIRLDDVEVFVSADTDALEDHFLPTMELQEISSNGMLGLDRPKFANDGGFDVLEDTSDLLRKERVNLHIGRMDVETELKNFKASTNIDDGMWVISCGGRHLVSECSKWGHKLGAIVHEEIYDV